MTYAFPHEIFDRNLSGRVQHQGMTLRDYFAAQALAGILANSNPHSEEWTVRRAYEHADAMLKARGGG
jgi:hypothetical protein